MNRRDMILIAVLINAGLLAVLFATAVIYDTDKVIDQTEINSALGEVKAPNSETASSLVATVGSPEDEMENILNYYSSPSTQPIIVETHPEIYTSEISPDDEGPQERVASTLNNNGLIEVTVKKGDMLEKIARVHGSTVSAIKKANQLKSEKLQIGQVLKIPIKSDKTVSVAVTTEPVPSRKIAERLETSEYEPAYYIIKSGDNPWKIARQFNVKFEDILRLNQLDEDKARNLKVGDRIRVK